LLKTVPINQAIEQYGIKAMFTGSRWDEHGARGNETYFSPRSSLEHMRIHPILHLTGRDAWEITHGMDIPHNSLYQLGYRLLGSKTGTKKPAEIQAWEQDLEGTSVRGGRNEEKVKVMAQLRTWRYM
jgi:phosphoadenosine phosphosulfate reductase